MDAGVEVSGRQLQNGILLKELGNLVRAISVHSDIDLANQLLMHAPSIAPLADWRAHDR
jgi:hypothetical protein